MKRYPNYKDSGVEWLWQVPEHWPLSKIGHLATIAGGGTPSREKIEYWNGDIPWVSPKDMKVEDVRESEEMITQLGVESSTTAVVPAGSVLMVIRSGILQHTIPVGINSVPVALNQDLKSFQFLQATCLPRFFLRWVQGLNDSLLLEWMNEGATVESFDLARIKNMVLPLPPVDEQRKIVEFLDRETAKIDGLVGEQRRLIELLKEKRQAVISHAVTKGLNPNVKLKPSGIDWLGDVPEHWEVRTIAKATTKITNGYVGPTREILVESGTPYIQATHIKRGRVNFDGEYFVRPEWSNQHAKSILAEGDVLVVQTGAGTGDVGLVSSNEVGFNCHALIILTGEREVMIGPYLAAVLQSDYGRQRLESIQTGGMHPHLNCGNVKFIEIPVPPQSEQISIVFAIKETTDRFDSLTAEAEKAILLLQERRTALISAAVTGKIDVRAIQAEYECRSARFVEDDPETHLTITPPLST